jgi:hypothetical protein
MKASSLRWESGDEKDVWNVQQKHNYMIHGVWTVMWGIKEEIPG